MTTKAPLTSTRIDKYTWAIRLYKTRSDATDAARAGHLKLNGTTAKPAATVKVGDRIQARIRGWDREVEVTAIIDKRVGAAVAATCYLDRSGPRPQGDPATAPVFLREQGTGRPTKRDRRQMDRFRGR